MIGVKSVEREYLIDVIDYEANLGYTVNRDRPGSPSSFGRGPTPTKQDPRRIRKEHFSVEQLDQSPKRGQLRQVSQGQPASRAYGKAQNTQPSTQYEHGNRTFLQPSETAVRSNQLPKHAIPTDSRARASGKQ
jgi:hypothetical protein